MQAISRNTPLSFEPRVYRNRPAPPQLVRDRSADELHTVYVVDADREIRESVSACLCAAGNVVVQCGTAAEYLNLEGTDSAACVILNICLPDLHGLDLQRKIIENGNPPVIFIGEHCDIASTVRAIKAGALDFHAKPLDLAALCASVRTALNQMKKTRLKKAELKQLQERFQLLTPREREVLPLIVGGLLNKQAASILGISEVTLQIHRSQVMRKMQADSLADLVRMAMKLRIPYWQEGKMAVVENQIKTSGLG